MRKKPRNSGNMWDKRSSSDSAKRVRFVKNAATIQQIANSAHAQAASIIGVTAPTAATIALLCVRSSAAAACAAGAVQLDEFGEVTGARRLKRDRLGHRAALSDLQHPAKRQ